MDVDLVTAADHRYMSGPSKFLSGANLSLCVDQRHGLIRDAGGKGRQLVHRMLQLAAKGFLLLFFLH